MIFQQTNPASLSAARAALVQKLAQQFSQQQKNKSQTPQPAAAYGAAGGGGAGGSVGMPVGLGSARNAGLTQNITGGDNVAAAIAARLGAINPRALRGEFSGTPGAGVGNAMINGGHNLGSSLLFAPGMDVNAPTPGGAPAAQAPMGGPAGGVPVPTPGPLGTPGASALSAGLVPSNTPVAPGPQQMDPASAPGTAPGGSGLVPIGGGAFYDPSTGKIIGGAAAAGAGSVVFGHGRVLQ